LIFARESTSPQLFEEMMPLIQSHYLEIARFQDIPLDPNFELYMKLDSAGALRVFTARSEEGLLLGYGCFLVHSHLHFKNSLQAFHDLLFIEKAARGHGGLFIKYCDDQLTLEGVKVISYGVSIQNDWGAILKRRGYEAIDTVYARQT
jgi:hypothetical protein